MEAKVRQVETLRKERPAIKELHMKPDGGLFLTYQLVCSLPAGLEFPHIREARALITTAVS